MSTGKLDALIERIASEHGIILSQDDPVLMMHTLNEVLLEQNNEAHAELLSNYQAILEENFNRWCEYSTKKSNAIVSASISNTQLTRDQFLESCIQLIDERTKREVDQEIYELVRVSRQTAIINLMASSLLLISVVTIFLILL